MRPVPWSPLAARPVPKPPRLWPHVAFGMAVGRRVSSGCLPKTATVYLTGVTEELEGEPCEAIRYEKPRWGPWCIQWHTS